MAAPRIAAIKEKTIGKLLFWHHENSRRRIGHH